MTTYSFLTVAASIIGPGGGFALGNGAGVAEEGISVAYEGDTNVMATGADGEVMHSLRAAKSGSVIVRLLKTSKTNQLLNLMYNLQRATPTLHGSNVISISDTARGDIVLCRQCAFKRHPSITYAAVGQMMEWEWHVGKIDPLLGSGTPEL